MSTRFRIFVYRCTYIGVTETLVIRISSCDIRAFRRSAYTLGSYASSLLVAFSKGVAFPSLALFKAVVTPPVDEIVEGPDVSDVALYERFFRGGVELFSSSSILASFLMSLFCPAYTKARKRCPTVGY